MKQRQTKFVRLSLESCSNSSISTSSSPAVDSWWKYLLRSGVTVGWQVGQNATAPQAERASPNIYYYKIRVSFVKEILSFWSTFRHEIENSSSIRELADLLIIKNHFMSSCFPEVCTAFLLFVIIPVTTTSAERSIFKITMGKNVFKKFYGTWKVTQLSYSNHGTFHDPKFELWYCH